jgi:YQGE family putative transporter
MQILPFITAGLNAPLHILKPLKNGFLNEVSHYRKLSSESRRLLLSILLFTLALPLLSVFMNSFLWRESKSVSLITLYNIATFIGMPLGFFINAWLLKKYQSKVLYFWGSLLQGLIVAMLLFLPSPELFLILISGVAMGMVSGIYWANRIMIVMQTTKSHQRTYFVSLELILVTMMGIIMPLFIGWFIVTGESFWLGWSKMAYQILAVVLVIIMFVSGWIIYKNRINVPLMKDISPIKPSRRWITLRALSLTVGMAHGVEVVLPGLLILLLVGTERSLGTIMAISGIFVSLSLYQIAKKVGKRYRFRTLCVATAFSILGGLIFGFTYSVAGVICYFILNSFASTFRGTIIGPIGLDVIGSESARQQKHSYLYLADRELYVNIGRNIALGTFFVLFIFNNELALRVTPLLFSLPLIAGLWLMSLIEKELVWEDFMTMTPVYCYLKADLKSQ